MKRTHKLLAVLLAALMLIAVLPAASIADSAAERAEEARKLALLDKAWESINAVEAEAYRMKASPAEVTLAAYKAALNEELVDRGSLIMDRADQFCFTVEGMACGYSYRIRHTAPAASIDGSAVEAIAERANSAGSPNVLLVGPYYGSDSSFSNQYRTEAQSIANKTGGTYTLLSGSDATATAIAANYPDKGVVIYDSHGACYYSTTYLCLTTGTGITSSDLSKRWAINFGDGDYGIDGRYIQNHVTGTLSDTFVWMAICEGMMKSTTATALRAKGAAVVYGYSQSVTFTGDYKYEAKFWSEMKKGRTVAQAIATMKSTYGNYDPNANSGTSPAYPVVVSATDSYPSNPDSAQTVTSDWVLFASTYTVTFVDWDGTVLKTQEVEPGQSATAPANPTRPGYTFTGWDKDFTNVQSNLTVTAQYTANLYTLTIEYVYEDGLQAAEPYVAQLAAGETYYVTSPDVPDASPDVTDVYGIMPAGDRTVTVTYYYDFVADPIPGDVDGDGVVTMADVTLLAMYLNGENPSITSAGLQNADANASGGVDIRDIAAIYAMIANS